MYNVYSGCSLAWSFISNLCGLISPSRRGWGQFNINHINRYPSSSWHFSSAFFLISSWLICPSVGLSRHFHRPIGVELLVRFWLQAMAIDRWVTANADITDSKSLKMRSQLLDFWFSTFNIECFHWIYKSSFGCKASKRHKISYLSLSS